MVRDTCREEKVSLVLVTHTPQVAEQFERVENLEDINRLTRGDKAEGGKSAAAGKLQAEVPKAEGRKQKAESP